MEYIADEAVKIVADKYGLDPQQVSEYAAGVKEYVKTGNT
jgi:hypothetical protein